MSLDIYLTTPETIKKHGTGIFVREGGQTKEISVAEWNRRNPDRTITEEDCPEQETTTNTVFIANITHNLGRMADAAGIYQALWRPDEENYTTAKQLIAVLAKGLSELRSRPGYFKTFNPENGWGTYELLVEFVSQYLIACITYPDAAIRVRR